MDRGCTPVFTEARVRKAERDCEAEKPSPFGPQNDGELPRRHLRSSEVEHPRDAAVAQGMDLIRIGHVAHRGLHWPLLDPDIPGKGTPLFNLCRDLTTGAWRVSGCRDTIRACVRQSDLRPDVRRLGWTCPSSAGCGRSRRCPMR